MTVERLETYEQAILDAFLEVPEVDFAEDHRPEMVQPNTVCLLFDDEVPGERATSRVERTEFQWIVQIYVHGYERRDMQKRMQRIILGIRKIFRENPTLSGVLKKKARLDSLGVVRPIRMENNNPALVKGYRLGIEREVR